jgi:hypothetical protein
MSLSDEVVKLDSSLPMGMARQQELLGFVQQGWDCQDVVMKAVCGYAEQH